MVNRNTTLLVEAVEQSIDVDVIRSLGSVGVVSVDVVTKSGSAIGQVGPNLHLSHLQSVSLPEIIDNSDRYVSQHADNYLFIFFNF